MRPLASLGTFLISSLEGIIGSIGYKNAALIPTRNAMGVNVRSLVIGVRWFIFSRCWQAS